jgi:hypothetical protein
MRLTTVDGVIVFAVGLFRRLYAAVSTLRRNISADGEDLRQSGDLEDELRGGIRRPKFQIAAVVAETFHGHDEDAQPGRVDEG